MLDKLVSFFCTVVAVTKILFIVVKQIMYQLSNYFRFCTTLKFGTMRPLNTR